MPLEVNKLARLSVASFLRESLIFSSKAVHTSWVKQLLVPHLGWMIVVGANIRLVWKCLQGKILKLVVRASIRKKKRVRHLNIVRHQHVLDFSPAVQATARVSQSLANCVFCALKYIFSMGANHSVKSKNSIPAGNRWLNLDNKML